MARSKTGEAIGLARRPPEGLARLPAAHGRGARCPRRRGGATFRWHALRPPARQTALWLALRPASRLEASRAVAIAAAMGVDALSLRVSEPGAWAPLAAALSATSGLSVSVLGD